MTDKTAEQGSLQIASLSVYGTPGQDCILQWSLFLLICLCTVNRPVPKANAWNCRRSAFPALAGSSAFGMQVCCQNLLFSGQDIVGQKLCFYVLESKTVNGLSQTLPGLSLLPE